MEICDALVRRSLLKSLYVGRRLCSPILVGRALYSWCELQNPPNSAILVQLMMVVMVSDCLIEKKVLTIGCVYTVQGQFSRFGLGPWYSTEERSVD